jgi:hypothetical protein
MVDGAVHSPEMRRSAAALLGTAHPAFAFPPLLCPFAAVPNHPAVEELIEHTIEWTTARGLLPDEPGAVAKARSHGMLAARCYPAAPFDRLAIISDFINWLLSDDACENLSLDGAPPREIHRFLSRIYTVIGVPDVQLQNGDSRDELFTQALRDIWSRITRASTPQWRRRFASHVRNYIEGCVWEAANRQVEQVPSRAVYLSMRSYTSGMYLFWDLIELTGDFLLPDTVVENPLVVELARAANMVVALSNDIFSLHKESSSGDIHNIVIVLQQEEALTREEACLRAAGLHDAQVRHYCALEKLLPSFGSEIDRDLARYCEGMRVWMRANDDWSRATPRYNPGRP